MTEKKYTKDEKKVAEYLNKIAGIGGGLDPIGFILTSHEELGRRNTRGLKRVDFLIEKYPDMKEDLLRLKDILRYGTDKS